MNGKHTHQEEVYTKTVSRVPRNGRAEIVMRRPSADSGVMQCDEAELLHFVQMVVGHGDLCSFTQTSDGGAICICILAGDRSYKSYARSADEFLIRFTDLLARVY